MKADLDMVVRLTIEMSVDELESLEKTLQYLINDNRGTPEIYALYEVVKDVG